MSRASAVLLLHEAGFATEVAADGPGALEAARRQRYDAILVDARMPGMDGTAAIRALRSLAPRPAGPVVLAMTASVDARDRSALLDAGADACLVKPLDGDSLRGALAAAARAAQGAAVRRPALAAAVRDTIIGLFLEDTPLLLATLTDAARRGDAAALALAAHRLRGSVATVGASDLLPIATELDACAERGEIAVAARLLQSFGIEWERTRVRLEQTRRVPA